MKVILGRVGKHYPEGYGMPAVTSYPSNDFYAPEHGIWGVVQGVTGRDPAMSYADCIARTICEGILRAVETYSETALKEPHNSSELLRQLIVAGSEALVEVSREKGGPLILSKTNASIAVARVQQHKLSVAYLGNIRVRLIRSGCVEFRNKPHTLRETGPVRLVLTRALCVPQDPDLIDVEQIVVQPDDIILISTWVTDEVIKEEKTDWAKYLTAFGPDIENADRQLASLMQSSDLVSRMTEGAAWTLTWIE